MRFFVCAFLGAVAVMLSNNSEAGSNGEPRAFSDAGTSITLEFAVAVGRKHNPAWAEHRANREAALAEVTGARLPANPELELGAGRAKTREAPVVKSNEFEIGISQRLELPHKRRVRRKAAEAGIAVVERERGVFGADLRAQIARAYANARYQQEAAHLSSHTLALAAQLEALVSRRVEGGEVARIDLIKASVERLQAQTELQSQQLRIESARVELETLCGNALPAHWIPADPLPSGLPEISLEDALTHTWTWHPELQRIDAVETQKQAEVERERAAWHPDARPGISVARELDTESFRFQLGIELPLFNRNQGGIANARAGLNKTKAERVRIEQTIAGQVRSAWQGYEGARGRLAASRELYEAAREALDTETFLYSQGEHDLLQLLDARRTAQATENQALSAGLDAALARTDLEHAMGYGGNESWED